jgi:hypothetical protein
MKEGPLTPELDLFSRLEPGKCDPSRMAIEFGRLQTLSSYLDRRDYDLGGHYSKMDQGRILEYKVL